MTGFLSQFLLENNLEGFIISKPENVRYLTGFAGSFGFVLVEKTVLTLVTDQRYETMARPLFEQSGISFIRFDASFTKAKASDFTGLWGIEDTVTLNQKVQFETWFSNAEIKAFSGLCEPQRIIKSASEIRQINQAQKFVNQRLHGFMKQNLRPGITERDLAFRLEIMLRHEGRHGLSFDPIVAFGENSAGPHHSPGSRKLQRNENVLVDCGIKVNGYCCDMTRNYWFGTRVSPDYALAFDALLKVQTEVLQHIVAGVSTVDLHQRTQKLLGNRSEYFTHSLGHGVGLEIHEGPSLGPRKGKDQDAVLETDMVVTCEPGLYYPGQFGIRIEDMVVVKKQKSQVLTASCRKDLVKIS